MFSVGPISKRCANLDCPHSEPLPACEFYARRSAADGLQSWCKTCSKAKRKEWADANRKRLRRLDRKMRTRRKRNAERMAIVRELNRTGFRRRHNISPDRWRVGRIDDVTVPSAVVHEAIKASGHTVAVVAAWAAVPDSGARKALQRDEMPAHLATALLDAIGVLPVDLGL